MTVATILLLAAIVLFILSALGIRSRVGLTDIGLACIAGALLMGRISL